MRMTLSALCLVSLLVSTTASAQANVPLPRSPAFLVAAMGLGHRPPQPAVNGPAASEEKPAAEGDDGGPSAGAIVGWVLGGIALALGVGLLVTTLSDADEVGAI